MNVEEINRNNLAIFMPCEFHTYLPIDKEVKVCTECGMYSYWPLEEPRVAA